MISSNNSSTMDNHGQGDQAAEALIKAFDNLLVLQQQDHKELQALALREWANNEKHTAQAQAQSSSSSSSSGPLDFGEYFQLWLLDEARNLEDLRAATTESTQSRNNESFTQKLEQRVSQAMRHYENYYSVKSDSVSQNVVHMLAAAWMSPLEHAFFWIGGWRPTSAFHLLHSLVGIQVEARLTELLHGSLSSTGHDLAELSSTQLICIDELQKQTVVQERDLTEALAALQETIADANMVKLARVATQLMRQSHGESGRVECDSVNAQVKLNLEVKEDKLKEVFGKADKLRLNTLKSIVHILSPVQAAHFLIAAAELHLRLHDWAIN